MVGAEERQDLTLFKNDHYFFNMYGKERKKKQRKKQEALLEGNINSPSDT